MDSEQKALEIVRKKGVDLDRNDEMEISRLLSELPLEEWFEATTGIYEIITLIVNDPDYRGDIVLTD
ncbi:hypothetical protein GRI62_11845 [Erythrobacter arachoides]|uniref:Uncharacterized protein n=1 Tax=Aurantiacibacter arachoides TaxID=1850444 RepID=A0A845A2X9_9SPHN|nr:hypothetical protein [Aurantiacibacter arachoides]GGD64659.1 hypothetical protein GCM10011411_26200 [Aurantiacibacter arachoides]